MIISISPTSVEIYRFLKNNMERTYKEFLNDKTKSLDRESVYRVHISWLSMGIWNENFQNELNLGELFGVLMALYDEWVKSDIHLSDQDLRDFIQNIYFSTKEIFQKKPVDKVPLFLGQLVCGKDAPLLKIIYWGIWIVEMSAAQEFPCKLIE
jgi:hypothetical protein